MTTWPEHFIVYCIGKGGAVAHPPAEIYRIGVDLSRELIAGDPHHDTYVVGLSFDERVNRDRLRSTTDVWTCADCGLTIRMRNEDPRLRHMTVAFVEAGCLRVPLTAWIAAYHRRVAEPNG